MGPRVGAAHRAGAMMDEQQEQQQKQERLEQTKRAFLQVLKPLGFEDNNDREKPGTIFHPATHLVIECDKVALADLVQAIFSLGKECGVRALQAQLRQCIDVPF
jgi:hypothetical protein